jgi:SAM-dependent methyltransferase
MYGTYTNADTHYFSVGQSALDAIRVCMHTAGKRRVERILDLPCGHGRVLRHLKAAFPDAALTACDLNRDGVDFCARTFGAHPVYGNTEPARTAIDGTFDLIWCGSLLTHFQAAQWLPLLRWFASRLDPGGLLVFTTLGRVPAAWVGRRLASYGLHTGAARTLARAFERKGFGYASYPQTDAYGIAMASPAWVLGEVGRVPTLRVVHYGEALWDAHQDVIACTRMNAAPGDTDYLASAPHHRVLRILGELAGDGLPGSRR